MAGASSLKRRSAIAIALLALSAPDVRAQDAPNPDRVNQDELASFYGRMNVVVGSGARALGMGGAFLARADDATAASWNPAGLSYLRRTEVSLVGVQNNFSQTVTRRSTDSVTGADNSDRLVDRLHGAVADFVGVVLPFRLKGRAGAVQGSYQRSFSFTGTRRNEGPVATRGFATAGERVFPTDFTVDGEGGFDTISLSSGIEVNPRVRLGLSLNRWVRGFSQTVTRPNIQNPNGFREIASTWDISGTNVNLGLLLTPTERLNLGAVLKTPFTAGVDLAKRRTDPKPTAPDDRTSNSASGNVLIRFPRVYGLGASLRVTNTLTFSADFTRTAWSKSTITNFFTLGPGEANIDRYPLLPFPAVESEDGQVDANQIRMGGEWVIRRGSSGNILFPIRAGFFRDGQPFRSAGKAPVFTGLTVGAGITIGSVLFDVAYIREMGDVNSTVISGQTGPLEVRYNRLFASMIVRFGPRR